MHKQEKNLSFVTLKFSSSYEININCSKIKKKNKFFSKLCVIPKCVFFSNLI